MRELFQGYLRELSWPPGVTKDDLVAHLAGRDEALRTMVDLYVAEGTYYSAHEVISVIPVQAWQDVQGDDWRGAEIDDVADVASGLRAGPAGQDDRDTYRTASPPPPTPGFGHSGGAAGEENPASDG
jgi:hypothetical protein